MPNKVTGDALIKLIVIQVRLHSYCALVWQTGQKKERKGKRTNNGKNLVASFSVQNFGMKTKDISKT